MGGRDTTGSAGFIRSWPPWTGGLGEGSWRSILSLPESLWEALGREPLLELASGGSQVVSGEIFRLPLGEGPLFCAVDPREDRAEFCQAYPGYTLLEKLGPDA